MSEEYRKIIKIGMSEEYRKCRDCQESRNCQKVGNFGNIKPIEKL